MDEKGVVPRVQARGIDDEQTPWTAFLRAHALVVRVLDQRMSQAGAVPLSWFDVLSNLARVPGQRRTQADLHADLVISQPALSRLLDRLLRDGLVDRSRDDGDRRLVWYALTTTGRDVLRRSSTVHDRIVHELFYAQMSAPQQEELAVALTAVMRAAAAARSQPRAGRRAGRAGEAP